VSARQALRINTSERGSKSVFPAFGRQEMAWTAAADGYGECDCSLRAGPPGLVLVLDP
jgi:hypothetical protein